MGKVKKYPNGDIIFTLGNCEDDIFPELYYHFPEFQGMIDEDDFDSQYELILVKRIPDED